MLLCCSDETLARKGVQEEIGIAEDLVKEIPDERFVIPLRIRPFKKLFGIGELQWIDFVPGWAAGLSELLKTLERQKVPRGNPERSISPDWAIYRKKLERQVEHRPEVLTSNWLPVRSMPDSLFYYVPRGSASKDALVRRAKSLPYAAIAHDRGFISFAEPIDIADHFEGFGAFQHTATSTKEFISDGSKTLKVNPKIARDIVVFLMRRSWEQYAVGRGLLEYRYSNQSGFHATKELVGMGKRIHWGRQGENRSSMLRNLARGRVWQFGLTAIPQLWPFPHFRMKGRVLFSDPLNGDAGPPIDDRQKQHGLRRSICSGWRNKAWHGRLMAMLELLAGETDRIALPVGSQRFIELGGTPIQATSPVTTDLPDTEGEGEEEPNDDGYAGLAPEVMNAVS
jgi:hypothetical protein